MSRIRRISKREERLKSKNFWGVVIIAIVVGVLGLCTTFYISAKQSVRPLDKETLCPTDDAGPNSINVVLIDRTDKFSPTQQAAIRDKLEELRAGTEKYDLIQIYSVGSTQVELLQPEFSMCNPGRGKEISEWTGNPHLVESKWKRLFGEPLQRIFDTALDSSEAQTSPIMESIQSISVTAFNSHKNGKSNHPKRLIVISDLMQHVADYSQYNGKLSFLDFKTKPYYQKIRSDLSRVSVSIWYIHRQNTVNLQTKEHFEFWQTYFADQGASVDSFWPVPGM
jgi:hypothetical protein